MATLAELTEGLSDLVLALEGKVPFAELEKWKVAQTPVQTWAILRVDGDEISTVVQLGDTKGEAHRTMYALRSMQWRLNRFATGEYTMVGREKEHS